MGEGRARRAMELLSMADVTGIVFSWERPAAVAAARDILQEEFNDVRLRWVEIPGTNGLWELGARGPGGEMDQCWWTHVRPEEHPWRR